MIVLNRFNASDPSKRNGEGWYPNINSKDGAKAVITPALSPIAFNSSVLIFN